MASTLFPLLLALAGGASTAGTPASDLILAGGALRTCSDLAPSACRRAPQRTDARTPPRFVVDDAGARRALEPALWAERDGAPDRRQLLRMLSSARAAGTVDADAMAERFDAVCLPPCRDDRDRPWRRLVDEERAALLSALEVPQGSAEARPREQAYLDQSRESSGVAVLRAFVESARLRANGEPPRIAVVTASALDPMEPVDFYLDAFRQLGAKPEWWPLDAALRDAIAAGDCRRLDTARQQTLGMSGRDRIYADLGALQWRACLAPESLAAVPGRVQGVFFAGGDQWRHRRAFFDDSGQPLPWLVSLRDAHARGSLVVGGTSAGTAVQGGAAMLSNGTTREALLSGTQATAPPAPGCGRARRCAGGLPEDALTYWSGGGLGLLPGWSLDTHFSERARELRLLRLMHDAGVDFAAGVDETSALAFRRESGGWTVHALGAHGGWVFERLPGEGRTLRARVHYLAPGARLHAGAAGVRVDATGDRVESVDDPMPVDALDDGALRAAAARLAAGEASVRLPAAGGIATLSRSADTRAWRSQDGRAGASHLILQWTPGD